MALRSLLHISLFLIAFGSLYHNTLAHIADTWFTSEGSHGPLIVVVSFYLVWRKRKDFKELPKNPAVLPGALLTGLGCFMLFAGRLSSTMLLQQVSMGPTLLGIIWLFLGFRYVKALLIPVGYLIFLTGFVEEMLGSVAIYIQTVSAWIAALLLVLFGMPVLLNGIVIELPHISLEVVRACSGINHIVALMALSVPLAMMSQRTAARKCLLVLAALLIGVFANGLRVALIGVYALYNEGADLHGPNETLYVTFIFFFGMVLLVALSHVMRKIGPRDSAVGRNAESTPVTGARKEPACGRRFVPVITAGLLFFITLGLVHFYKPAPVRLNTPFQAFPAFISGFVEKPLDNVHERIRPFAADQELLRLYKKPSGERLVLYIGYFESQDREKKIIDYRRDWMHEEAQEVSLGHASEPVMINKTRLRDRTNPADVYFWYLMDGRIITNRYVGKLATFWGALAKRKTNAAVIIIQTQNREDEVMPFLRELVPIIHAHLSGDQS